ncbi:MAG: DUF4012 domain-containing protein [Anaerolineales bacterium]|nr:DUF4012 domain-containing protein [Anaerolineales bacterium]
MRDANWSPDLPTSAAVAKALYAQDGEGSVDGVFTLDLNAVKHLFGALGDVKAPGSDEVITADNIEAQLIRLWERPAGAEATLAGGVSDEWWAQRKDFIPQIAREALDRIQGGKANLPALAMAVQAALTDRSIQAWVADPNIQAVLAEARWDGSIQPAQDSDFLAVIDTNMGYNKVDAAMQRQLDYRVEWVDGPQQPATATLTLTYTHPITTPDPGCDPTRGYGETYADMIARCYFDYVRVYAPGGSELIAVDGIAPEDVLAQAGEAGTEIFSGYFVTPTNSQQRITFTYRLPAALKPASYQLLLQRQPGTQPLPVTLHVNGADTELTLTEGWMLWSPE